MFFKHAPHDIFIDVDAEGLSDLLSNARAAEPWITPFHLNDGANQLWRRAFRAGL